LAVDINGNLYEYDLGSDNPCSGNIYKFTPEGVRTTFFTCAGAGGYTIVFDNQGNLYVPSDAIFPDPPGCNEGCPDPCANCLYYIGVYKIDPQGAVSVPYFLPPNWGAAGIAFDSGSNLWVVSHNGFSGTNNVFVNPHYYSGQGADFYCPPSFGGGVSNSLAIDQFNNVYIEHGGSEGIFLPCSSTSIIDLSNLLFGETLGQLVIEPPAYAAQVQQPINADGTSIFNSRRGVVAVRFALTYGGAATCALPPATIAVTRTGGGVTGNVNESIYTASADTGSNFRISGCQYMYNLNSSAHGVGIYRVDIKILAGLVVGSATFELR
jgi:hypothetical protein